VIQQFGRDFVDVWDAAGTDDSGHTWMHADPTVGDGPGMDCRIDYVLAGRDGFLVQPPGRLGQQPVDGLWASDHAAVVVDLLPRRVATESDEV
jgi:hypothetical protein